MNREPGPGKGKIGLIWSLGLIVKNWPAIRNKQINLGWGGRGLGLDPIWSSVQTGPARLGGIIALEQIAAQKSEDLFGALALNQTCKPGSVIYELRILQQLVN